MSLGHANHTQKTFFHANFFFSNKDTSTVTLKSSIEIRSIIAPKIIHHSAQNSTIYVEEIGHNFTLHCGYRIKGDPPPLIEWFDEKGQEIEAVLVQNDQGSYFKYVPTLDDGNKTLHFVSNPIEMEVEKIRPRDLELVSSFEGKYFCSASNRGGRQTVFTEVQVKTFLDDKKSIIWAGSTIAGIVFIAVAILVLFCCYHK